jgi:membrane protein DedA with SNARE-associated domain
MEVSVARSENLPRPGGKLTFVMDWILRQPFVLAAVFLVGVAAVRSQCTYWLGRAVRAGVIRSAWATKMSSEAATRAVRWLERWGWPIIPVSFLTVGFQTAVNLSAGLVGWRWSRYTLAAIPGWLAWGCIYAAGGLAVFVGLGRLAQRSPVAAVAVGLLLVAAIAATITLVKRAKARRASAPEVVPAALVD